MCAASVDMIGGWIKDGGSIVGASVFYYVAPGSGKKKSNDKIAELDSELKSGSKNVKEAQQQNLSTFVWICTSTHSFLTLARGQRLDPARVNSGSMSARNNIRKYALMLNKRMDVCTLMDGVYRPPNHQWQAIQPLQRQVLRSQEMPMCRYLYQFIADP